MVGCFLSGEHFTFICFVLKSQVKKKKEPWSLLFESNYNATLSQSEIDEDFSFFSKFWSVTSAVPSAPAICSSDGCDGILVPKKKKSSKFPVDLSLKQSSIVCPFSVCQRKEIWNPNFAPQMIPCA